MDSEGRRLERHYQGEPTKENLHQLAIYRARIGESLIDITASPRTSNSVLYLYCPIEMVANSYAFDPESYLAIQAYYNQILRLVESFAGRVIILHNETWLVEGLSTPNRDQAYTGLNQEFFRKLEYLNTQDPDKYGLGLLQWNSSSGYQEYYHVWTRNELKPNYSGTEPLNLKSLVVSPSQVEHIYIAGGRLDRTLEFLNNLRSHYVMAVSSSFWERNRIGLLWKTTYGYAKLGSAHPSPFYRSSQDPRTHIESNIVGYSSGSDVPILLNTFLRQIRSRIYAAFLPSTAVIEFDDGGDVREVGRN